MLRIRRTRFLIILVFLLVIPACASGTQKSSTPTQETVRTATLEMPTLTLEPTFTSTPEVAMATVAQNTNCRSGPSTDFPVEFTLPAGTQFVVLGRSTASDYYYVQNPLDPSQGGWVLGRLVTLIGGFEFLPVFTPPPNIYPTAVPAAPTPACKTNGTINIKNDTGGFVTLYLSGPAKFTFNIAAGSQAISVCPGEYSYTAYGCGGASRTGTIGTGDELKFWCD